MACTLSMQVVEKKNMGYAAASSPPCPCQQKKKCEGFGVKLTGIIKEFYRGYIGIILWLSWDIFSIIRIRISGVSGLPEYATIAAYKLML